MLIKFLIKRTNFLTNEVTYYTGNNTYAPQIWKASKYDTYPEAEGIITGIISDYVIGNDLFQIEKVFAQE